MPSNPIDASPAKPVGGLLTFLNEASTALAQGSSLRFSGAPQVLQQVGLAKLLCGQEARRKFIFILPTSKEAFTWWESFKTNLSFYIGERTTEANKTACVLLPHYGLWGHDRFINHTALKHQRLYALSVLQAQQKAFVFTTPSALMQRTLSVDLFRKYLCELKTESNYDLDALASQWEEMGYLPSSHIEDHGYYSIRGGIVDIFPSNHESPFRLEFLGDTLSSIRSFALSNQRSLHSFPQVSIGPASETILLREEQKQYTQKLFDELLQQGIEKSEVNGILLSFQAERSFPGFSLFTPIFSDSFGEVSDYVSKDDALVVFPNSIDQVKLALSEFLEGCQVSYKQDKSMQRPTLAPSLHFLPESAFGQTFCELLPSIELSGLPADSVRKKSTTLQYAPLTDASEILNTLPQVTLPWPMLQAKLEEGVLVQVAYSSPQQEELLLTSLKQNKIPFLKRETGLATPWKRETATAGKIILSPGELVSPFFDTESRLLFLPDVTLTGRTKNRRTTPSQQLKNYLSSFRDLKPGELVVHVTHGIGRYQGMRQMQVGGEAGEFLYIEYHGGDKIYLPVDRLNLLQKYRGEGSNSMALDRLSSPSWQKRKSKVKQAVKDIAADLLRINAKRKLAKAHRFSDGTELYQKFVDDFPYRETDDQLRAISEVEADLQSGEPMDRLIVGDVGFGKTEVALRAIFRVVIEGFQVLVLAPTTVLSYQHFHTFQHRLEKYGVRVGLLNRFVPKKEQGGTLNDLKQGKVDVLIGTHRILSKDIEPKKLGLIVIDEEQRFGVTHKERLKELRAQADILVLTATPIPRTLHMAMLGLKNISIIATPPKDRLPIRTSVGKFNEEQIKEAIEFELSRQGQVFFVHNRVEDIDEVCQVLRKLVPQASMQVAHGQMRETQLEKVIIDFLEQKFSVLVCTTIIESGIDMPNVNTLIVHKAENFGLAQLYQLRGRVGRSSAQAYAYFFIGESGRINEEAQKRLEIMQTHQELGSGFQIASYDLEMRGAGNLLGGEQSGNVASVGLEMYTEMLNQTVQELAGQIVEDKIDTELKINITALIPKDYVEREEDRLNIYKQIFSAELASDLTEIGLSLRDRYGPCPPELSRLLKVAELKLTLRSMRVTQLISSMQQLFELRFAPLKETQIAALMSATSKQPEIFQWSADYRLYVRLPSAASQDETLEVLLDTLRALS